MSQHQDDTDLQRRLVLQTVGAAMLGGVVAAIPAPAAAQGARPQSATARNSGPLAARLQGVQHFGLTVQNMDRAFAFTRRCSVARRSCATATSRASAFTTRC
jgi:hypothetical protein